MPKRVRTAVFPVAGLGTRFLPATKALPKEMLTVVDRPLIQYAVDEAREAGIEHFVFVTGRNKGVIEDHFDMAYELDDTLAKQEKGAGNEIQLTDSMIALAQQEKFFAVRFDGDIYDTGSKIGFLTANLAYALDRGDLGPQLREEIGRLLGR